MEEGYNINAIEIELNELFKTIPSGSLPILHETLERSIKKLHEPMQLAIIGKVSSSKSTLVNAILGKDGVMATGQMEVTYNVGWLKYGAPESDIIIHHKDGSPDSYRKPEEFLRWTIESDGRKELLNNVSYIETFDDAEILREINIIDTPGLDAVRGQDSQNTLDFLKHVRPDAVIMLFTNSVAENTLKVVQDFNRGGNFNPLNAIGVLSKIDILWMEDAEHSRTALQIGQRMAANTLANNPMLRKTLFNIYPISSLLFMRASTMTEEEFGLVRKLAVKDKDLLPCLMMSAADFVDPDYEVSINMMQRKELLMKLDLYAIDLIVRYIQTEPDANLLGAKKLLYTESGAHEFMTVLHNHFGGRAKLIKLESIYQNLVHVIHEERASDGGQIECQLLNRIEQRIADIFSALVHEHNEYELLNRIYCRKIELDDDVAEEFFRLCGEHGSSAPERLGFSGENMSAQDMIKYAYQREGFWRKELNDEFDPDEKEWKRVILSSYAHLRKKLQEMDYQYNQARAFLYNS